ncbi:SDR family oxidoreductase [Bacillus sp. NEB1478]|uniref:dTDP-4-dehydrorhamnose reductase family protein n=1 Tax=Bacillus sp. NEB1478 TaxID=3073816 RepID=UPI0028737554|nr:SDR family oxidoreductase [Bacillus sp. NEB1478]WNB93983.1 SDR family oxidoreductase [Bacillus sp. NEB1478]
MILGANGMAGHMIASYFRKNTPYTLHLTSRDDDEGQIKLDATDLNQIKEVIQNYKPDIIINCIGLLNEHAAFHQREAILVNSLLPHELKKHLAEYGGKLIHISTDCVFSGNGGNYNEESVPDGITMYAKTKVLGEIKSGQHLTIRTSLIGPEIKDGIGLFQWFMKQQGTIKGFTHVMWNGVTTLELAKFIHHAIENPVSGLYHLTAPETVSRHELLSLIKQIFQKDNINIIPHTELRIDRTLYNARLDYLYKVPSYKKQLQELKEWLA